MLFSQFLHSPIPKLGVSGLQNEKIVQNQGGANSNQNPSKNIQCEMLGEINAGVCSESGTKTTKERQNILTFYMFCAQNNTQTKKQYKESCRMSRRERQPMVHPHSFHKRQRDIWHILSKPCQRAWSMYDMLDRLHDEGAE